VLLGSTENTSLLAVPAVTLNALLVAEVSAPSVADKMKPVPTFVGTRFENVATPEDAATVVVEVPLKIPGLLIAIETFELSDVTVLPNWSSTLAVTAGEIAFPACVLDGPCANANFVAAPAFTVNELLVTGSALLSCPELPVTVMVKLPVFVIVTLCTRTPIVNDAVPIGAPTSAPVEVIVALLPFWS
jgi:hypothetical protein